MNAISPVIADPIRTFVPGARGEEYRMRCALLKASHLGWSRAGMTKHTNARSLYQQVGTVAGYWKFAPASVEQLKAMRETLVRLFCVAQAFEELEAPDGD